ncbi:MAG: DUF1553 domain-containing protein [Planctomycetales bacterium]|nr:DUF1553 domain-containing protein [Planctomycetales bacterium]
MRLLSLVGLVIVFVSASAEDHTAIVSPDSISLSRRFDRVQILVADPAVSPDRSKDLTHGVTYRSEDLSIATVDSHGEVTAIGPGQTTIVVQSNDWQHQVPVSVGDQDQIDFLKDIRPVLGKAGCAAGACHAAQYGKGGFKLSVFGFDPKSDYAAIARSSRGRRLNFANPDKSLLLSKPAMLASHGGGLRLEHDSVEYEMVRDWIASGAPAAADLDVKVQKLEVQPARRIGAQGYSQQLRVVAHYSDQTHRDVTALADYDAIDKAVVSVNPEGFVHAAGKGQTAVMVRYEGQVAVSTFVVPFREQIELADWHCNNFIDEIAAQKFRDLALEPSPLCDDATFVRRAFLDCIGALPTTEFVRDFLASDAANKRERLVDQLLGLTGDATLDVFNDQYAAFWTLRWSDLIRNNSNDLGEQGMWALHNWIKDCFRTNKPYDQFVRELVTAQGSIYSHGPANYFRINRDSSALTEATSQLFLGIRLECAKCHHHPFEKYGQEDYYSMAAFFSRVSTKNSEEFGLFGRETIVTVRSTGDVSHPRTGQRMLPTPLDGEAVDHDLDRRLPLAQWLTDENNGFFARAVVNRYMRYLLGSGLVEPVDDLRSTNPPSNIALMDALAADFVKHGYDLKHLIRTIMTSRLYGLSSTPTADNRSDHKFYSHFQVKRLAAEPLLDALDQATGVPTKFRNLPLGTRAIELPDAEYPNYFLTTFAKPRRVSVCECERSADPNLAQTLHTFNGETIAQKVADKTGLVAKLLEAKTEHDDLVTQLYLAALCRLPTDAELAFSRDVAKQSPTPQEAYQDLFWALINSKQFLFVH